MKKMILLWILTTGTAFAGSPTPAATQEISHLVSYLQGSGCQFNRNGTWYPAGEAVDHIDQKYRYLLKKGWVSSAEDFISRAASESSLSGRSYQVKCGEAAPVPSGVWLKAELARYRAGRDKSSRADSLRERP